MNCVLYKPFKWQISAHKQTQKYSFHDMNSHLLATVFMSNTFNGTHSSGQAHDTLLPFQEFCRLSSIDLVENHSSQAYTFKSNRVNPK